MQIKNTLDIKKCKANQKQQSNYLITKWLPAILDYMMWGEDINVFGLDFFQYSVEQ